MKTRNAVEELRAAYEAGTAAQREEALCGGDAKIKLIALSNEERREKLGDICVRLDRDFTGITLSLDEALSVAQWIRETLE